MYEGQVLLRMGSKGRSPTLAKRVRSLVNIRGGHELFMFDPKEEESLQKLEIIAIKKEVSEDLFR